MRNIKITIKKELRAIVRDKKSLLMMALTPIFIPIFIFLMSTVYDSMVNKEPPTYNIGINYIASNVEDELLKQNNLNYTKYSSVEEMEKAYQDSKIIGYITKDNNNYTIYANEESEEGSYLVMYIESYLESYNNYLGRIYLEENNIDSNEVYNNITYNKTNSIFGSEIINIAIIFTIMSMTLSAVYTATDITAGEKERGTLETLLTYPIKSSELILGKFFAIIISTLITLVISLILMIVSLSIVQNNTSILENSILNINALTIFISFIILFTYSFFISGICITLASFARTYKEAQSTLTPVSLVICVPMFLQLLNFKLHGIFTIIPILNHSFIISDIFSGSINKVGIILTIVSSVIYSLLLVYIIIWQYKSEKVLFGKN